MICTFRMERLNLKQRSIQEKIWPLICSALRNIEMGAGGTHLSVQSDWILGGFHLATDRFCLLVLVIVQVNKPFWIYIVLACSLKTSKIALCQGLYCSTTRLFIICYYLLMNFKVSFVALLDSSLFTQENWCTMVTFSFMALFL